MCFHVGANNNVLETPDFDASRRVTSAVVPAHLFCLLTNASAAITCTKTDD